MAVNSPRDPLAIAKRRKRRQQQIRRRRMVLAASVLALIVLVVVLILLLSGGDSPKKASTVTTGGDTTSTSTTIPTAATYTALLTGANSVPAVDTEATGELSMTYDPDNDELKFSLTVHKLSSPKSAAIYEGTSGTGGSVVYMLHVGSNEAITSLDGVLEEGVIDPSHFTGVLKDKTVGDLIELIKSGKAYVSIGNDSYPVDAIRGPIK